MQELVQCIERQFMTYLQSEQTIEMKRKWIRNIKREYSERIQNGETEEEATAILKEKYGFSPPPKGKKDVKVQQPKKVQQPRKVQQPIELQQPKKVQQPMEIQDVFQMQHPMEVPNIFQMQQQMQHPMEVQNGLQVQQPIRVQNPIDVQRTVAREVQQAFFQQESAVVLRPKAEVQAKHSNITSKKGRVYQLLREHCDIICYDQVKEGLHFVCSERFVIFATDGEDSFFGFIGGSGRSDDKDAPIGYASRDKKCGRIANNLKDFLELVVYYPFWRDINLKNPDRIPAIDYLEKRAIRINSDYYKNQMEIASTLGISKNDRSIDMLYESLLSTPRFRVYDLQNNRYHELV